jgi:hypothetical protein
MGTPALDKRIVALLMTVKYKRLPWLPGDESYAINGATWCDFNEWIMCSGHIYSDAEICAMIAAGWLTIAGELDDLGRFTVAPGPALDEILKAAPSFDWDDDDIPF